MVTVFHSVNEHPAAFVLMASIPMVTVEMGGLLGGFIGLVQIKA